MSMSNSQTVVNALRAAEALRYQERVRQDQHWVRVAEAVRQGRVIDEPVKKVSVAA